MFKRLVSFFLLLASLSAWSQSKQQWVDSVFSKMKVEEKIGQLFLLPIPKNASPKQIESILEAVQEGKAGGIIQQKSSLNAHIRLVNQLQASSKVPLLISATVANGLGNVLDSTLSFYSPLVLGALENDSLISAYGNELAFQMKRAGIQLNLSETSSSDFYNDDSKKNIAKANRFLTALNENGVLTSSTWSSEADSAISPTQEAIVSQLAAIQYSLKGKSKMDEVNLQSLRSKFQFDGLLIADANELQKFSTKKKKGDAEKIGFVNGFDLIVSPLNIDGAIKQIKKAVRKDKSLATRLDGAVRRILNAKYQSGLAKAKSISPFNIKIQLRSPEAKLLKQELAMASVTVLQNRSELIPIKKLDDQQFVSVGFGKSSSNKFDSYLSKYNSFKHYQIENLSDTSGLYANISRADVVVVALLPSSTSFIKEIAGLTNKFAKQKEVIICSFSNAVDLKYFESIPTLMAAYSDDEESMKVAAQIIFGGLNSKGALPVKVSDSLLNGRKIGTSLSDRFSYQLPESAGMDSHVLEKIESIANEAIAMGATPGCYVQVVKDGKVIYDRGFGWLTYEKKSEVNDQTIYDLASITKVTATLQTVMYMYEHGMIDVYKKMSAYLPELKESNKGDFTIKDILTHQAGLWPFLPFWAETVKDSVVTKKYYGHNSSDEFPFPVADELFATRAMKDSLWQWIVKAKIREKVTRTPYDYRYSDMGFYILQHLAEKLLAMPMEDFLQKNLYQPIGASTMGYLPLRKFPSSQIAPTEDDKLFRKKLLVGYVHDQGAAMHGGIAGHAGLFSNANDLAKMGQLWLNGGSYGRVQFLNPETLSVFTAKQYEASRRGLGWDKPTVSDWNGPTTLYASAKTFGHTGFTGTSVWVDPEFNLVFVFLSNRVHPEMTNPKILNANIRPRIQEVVYQSIFKYRAQSK